LGGGPCLGAAAGGGGGADPADHAAHQDGESAPPKLLRWSGTLAAILPLPLGAIAVYALYLRVHQYGWTEDRVLVAAALAVAGGHALGYARAAVVSGLWLKRIESWNFIIALLTLGVMLLLSTPLADPRRIAVNDQMARLEHGAVKRDAFDVSYLRRDGGRYGRDALTRLSHGAEPRLQRDARSALSNNFVSFVQAEELRPPAEIAAAIKVYPAGKALPASFLSQEWNRPPNTFFSPCLRRVGMTGPLAPANDPPLCEAVLRDLDGNGKDEILLITTSSFGAQGHKRSSHATALFQQQPDGSWRHDGNIGEPVCDSDMAALRSGAVKFVPAAHPDIQIGGRQMPLRWSGPSPQEQCPENRN
jgi:hypothetical protein